MAKMQIDLNCDMGEGCPNDAALMQYVTSANIACGYHAGNVDTMRKTVALAVANGVNIGAHPGYPDQANFGRIPMDMSADEVFRVVSDQLAVMGDIADAGGGRLAHVKPHGALYNRSAKDPEIAAAIAEAAHRFDPRLALFGLSGSCSITEAKKAGIPVAAEAFADRTYKSDGSLTPRTEPGAVIVDPNEAVGQVLNIVKYGRARSTDAIMVRVPADTICLHGDNEHAVEFASIICRSLAESGVRIRSFNDEIT